MEPPKSYLEVILLPLAIAMGSGLVSLSQTYVSDKRASDELAVTRERNETEKLLKTVEILDKHFWGGTEQERASALRVAAAIDKRFSEAIAPAILKDGGGDRAVLEEAGRILNEQSVAKTPQGTSPGRVASQQGTSPGRVEIDRLASGQVTKELLSGVLNRFPFDGAPECSIQEGKRILEFLGGKMPVEGPDYVTAKFGGVSITVFLNSYARGFYGVRFGKPDLSYFGSNDTLIQLQKPKP